MTVSVFIPEGIALAGVLIYGKRILPGIFLGQFLLAFDSLGGVLAPSLGIATSNTIEAYLAYLLFKYLNLDKRLSNIKDVFGLLAMIIFILQPFSALMGVSNLWFFNIIKPQAISHVIFNWWFGNTMGQLLVTPMLLTLYFNWQKITIKALIFTIVSFIFYAYLLEITLNIDNATLLVSLTLPLTIYLSTRNLSYATISIFVLVSVSMLMNYFNTGTFSHAHNSYDNLIDLNFFVLSHIVLALLVGVLFRQKEEAIKALHSIAHYDPLTGLPNRHLLHEEIHHPIYIYEKYGQQSSICFIDLNKLKEINDTLGHHVGDEALKKIAHGIKGIIRPTDTLLRLGGDEFLLILSNITPEETEKQLKKCLEVISQPISCSGGSLTVSVSIGVANCPHDGTDAEVLINAADKAMYIAKTSEKEHIVYTQAGNASANISA
ncbi:diguanylate cyclase [Sulfurovum sp.]|uniref:sensor domain-containing diguanylate cyclase n=1 Tax=Sulfurovum sp. TaxID=1969726 RepID=UPI0025FCDFAE|nr:diguanylate cyclase [Sulfurovum sp.]